VSTCRRTLAIPPGPPACGGTSWRGSAGRSATRRPDLALTILVFNVTFGAAWSVLVLYARDRLGLGAVGYGLVTTVSAAGGLLGTAAYGWITRRLSLGHIMRIGLVTETLTHLGLALTRSPWIAGVIFFVFGAHAFVWGATSTTVRQRAVPTELQGRVGSVYMIAVFGGLVVGSGIGGVLASRYGLPAPFWFGSPAPPSFSSCSGASSPGSRTARNRTANPPRTERKLTRRDGRIARPLLCHPA
jgi:predicted MFS family arabinose efflux permease